MRKHLRWFWPILLSALAIGAFLTRDSPPSEWWWGVVLIALMAWLIELQASLIRDLKDQLARRMEADR